jgi:hypothetical protein
VKLVEIIRRLISGKAKPRTLGQAARSGAMATVRRANATTRTRHRPRDPVTGVRRAGPIKGTAHKSIIKSYVLNGRHFELHATKGWRCYRAG